MPGGPVQRARRWTELIEQLYEGSWNPDLQRFRSPYAFRGLSCVDHVLSHGLVRLSAGPDVAKLESAILRAFRKYAHDHTPSGVDSIWHWLAVAQHHGLPTRLVDWTYSPFVALHFATTYPADYTQDGVVWCVNFEEANKLLPKRLKTILEEEHSSTFTIEMLSGFTSLRTFDGLAREPFVVFIEPPSLDARILNQFALFSLMPSPSARLDE